MFSSIPLIQYKWTGVSDAVYPYTYVTCSQAQTLTSKLSTGKSYTSSLMFGVQWDLVLKHIEVKEVAKGTALATIQSALRSDSKDWGNYYNASFEINRGKYAVFNTSTYKLEKFQDVGNEYSKEKDKSILLTTGATERNCSRNIYDVAGNCWEWTTESNPSSDARIDRGRWLLQLWF